MFAEGLLRSGTKQNIHLAEELLTPNRVGSVHRNRERYLKSVLNVLNYKVSVNIVVDAAKEYFNSAASHSDPAMELSR